MYGRLFSTWSNSRATPWLYLLQNSFDIPQKAASLRSRLGTDVGSFSTLMSRIHLGSQKRNHAFLP